MSVLAFAVSLALSVGVQPPVTSQATVIQELSAENFDDIVVTARKGAPPPKLDAIGYFRRYCYEPNRMTGKSALPSDDLDWEPLGDRTRAQFGIIDTEIPAFGLADASRGSTLLLKVERFPKPGGLVESRCTMAVVGGDDHRRLPRQLSALFRGPGTQRHVGAVGGSPRVEGWEQWLWSAMPGRRSKSWHEINSETRGASRGTWIVVTRLDFYNDHDYVMGDLKTRQGAGKPLSVLTLAYTTKPSRTNLAR